MEWERGRRQNSPEDVSRGGARLGLAGVGRKWPSGHEIERGLALETACGTGKTPRASTWAYDGSAAAALAGVGRSGVPGLVLAWDLAQELELGMGDLLGHSERRDGAGRRIFADEGGKGSSV